MSLPDGQCNNVRNPDLSLFHRVQEARTEGRTPGQPTGPSNASSGDTRPPHSGGPNANPAAASSATSGPAPQQSATEPDNKAPLQTRNWIALGIFAGAAISAAAAVLATVIAPLFGG